MRRTKEKRQLKKEPGAEAAKDPKKGPVGEPQSEPTEESGADPTADHGAETVEVPCSVERLQAKVETLEDNLLRAKADYQNLQRRSAEQRAEAVRYANAELMKSLLGVLDDFERSLAAARTSENLKAVTDGVRLVYENFVKALRIQGLEPIEALHRPFDPNVHEAMMQLPSEDHPPGTVVDEVAKGYRLWDRVLRPAKVAVSRAVEVEQQDASGGAEGESEERR